ncbi:hypothetical protein [Cohaesibacter celericrescens]|uniref:Glutamine amidotransferase domain-containing protein n=1 Tax=Cohaesibacter celericrescens TaxID=2067669 RepID=A0A2N5XS05_9HYPH|nr:hypothetical protein [Cohaesibacter celericrescens]PLW77198.1 hypothetical protein C0081_10645 [Cohaesibacter celericrescens]
MYIQENSGPNPVIAAIDAGFYFHHQSLREEPTAHFFDHIVYIRDVPLTDLTQFDTVIIPCRTNAFQLAPLSQQFVAYMKAGGRLVVMGETFPDRWLPDVNFTGMDTNFWWWLEAGADLGVQIVDKAHPMAAHVSKEAATWHLHGTLDPLNDNQKSLIATKDGGCLMFEDVTSYAPGRLVVTTLDPFFHHGSHFMPTTTVFLEAFLTWLSSDIPQQHG